jgi:putative colanic acid biosynthesis acetyltransferase WcaF
MSEAGFHIHEMTSRHSSPWTVRVRVKMLLWSMAWPLLCGWTPKPLNFWRLFWLRIFGCKISGRPFVHQHARIQIPWHVTLHDRAAVGDRANLYSLGEIELRAGCVVAQEAYLCTGTHDFNDANWPLVTAKITIGKEAFVGARAFVMPGIEIGNGAIVGACSVVTANVPPRATVAGSPARVIGVRNNVCETLS